MLKKIAGVWFCALLCSANAMAAFQSCYQDMSGSAPDIRFQENKHGTVTDLQTNLVWRRCLMGTSWDSVQQTCVGAREGYSWKKALFQIDLNEKHKVVDGVSGWRLPNIKELVSLREVACISPALNLKAFPGLIRTEDEQWEVTTNVWSSTPHAASQTILSLGLNDGMVMHYGYQDFELGVLLVSDGAQ
ncbi:DUF1566 domain-containing protein [Photobacterium sp. 1_MG-2023]|uniref:Lcl C-terminal domain-containing protein n=1 Tax=Photobacterium sp. 1_MG-2023 TaxID=3062646 RepID=UPI0026E1FC55|nr:DUF1566 domain-containing protein [Photobacterium sp. 1_MG-2023]MDO6706500.1 DUF1566 domain-containing protein [Photobacterium sp. 1_MG-2023]